MIKAQQIMQESQAASSKMIKLAKFMKDNNIAFVVPGDEDRTISICVGSSDNSERVFSFKEEVTEMDIYNSLGISGLGDWIL